MMKIEPDIEQNVKKMIWQNEYLSRFLKIKILPHSNVKCSAKTGLQKPIIHQIDGNFIRILMDFSSLKLLLIFREKILFNFN